MVQCGVKAILLLSCYCIAVSYVMHQVDAGTSSFRLTSGTYYYYYYLKLLLLLLFGVIKQHLMHLVSCKITKRGVCISQKVLLFILLIE